MKEPRKMVEGVQGCGLIGVNVFFSTQDAYKLHELVGVLTQYSDKASSPMYDNTVGALIGLSDMVLDQFRTPNQHSVFGDEVH